LPPTPAPAAKLIHVVAAITARRGLDPLAAVIRKIVERHGPAERLRICDDRARNFASVERVAAILLQQANVREVGVFETRPAAAACHRYTRF
jgi:hypothetical protein